MKLIFVSIIYGRRRTADKGRAVFRWGTELRVRSLLISYSAVGLSVEGGDWWIVGWRKKEPGVEIDL